MVCPYVNQLSKVKYFLFLNEKKNLNGPLPPTLQPHIFWAIKFFLWLPFSKLKDAYIFLGLLFSMTRFAKQVYLHLSF